LNIGVNSDVFTVACDWGFRLMRSGDGGYVVERYLEGCLSWPGSDIIAISGFEGVRLPVNISIIV